MLQHKNQSLPKFIAELDSLLQWTGKVSFRKCWAWPWTLNIWPWNCHQRHV